jgi:hypothetical protein
MTTPAFTLEFVVGPEIFEKAGLGKLTQSQQLFLASWIEDTKEELARVLEKECRERIKNKDKDIGHFKWK